MNHTVALPSHILLVDDSRDGRLVRRSLLEEQGYQVQTAHDGEEGLKLFQTAHFDLVVTDYRMPRMTGVELIVCIRQTNPNARIILISGMVEPLGLNEENTGADAVIAKSANEPSLLMRAVKRLLNQGPARKPPSTQRSKNPNARAVRQ
jgi:two-component system sensor histidine kinase and response regulator WspE